MTKTSSEYFMAYEATKVFAIRKMKTQFTNKNTHILRIDILHKHAVSYRKLFLIGGLKTRAEDPRKFLRLHYMVKTLIPSFLTFLLIYFQGLKLSRFPQGFFKNIKMRPKYNEKCFNHRFFCRESCNCN
jgi:hypothetical protein